MVDESASVGIRTSAKNRTNSSPLARLERALLDWLAPRMPPWVTPDGLTAFGVFGAFITFLGYAICSFSEQFLWLASAGLAMHWFGDSLDGGLARYRGVERPRYGFFLDQNIDVFGNLLIGGGLAASPFIRLEPAVAALFGYQALAIYALVRFNLDGVFQMTVLNFGPTEVRVLLILMNFLILIFGAPIWILYGLSFSWCDIAIGFYGLCCFCTFAWLIAVEAPVLRREDDRTRLGRADRRDDEAA